MLSQEELQQIIREGVEKIKAASLDRLKADLKPTVQGQLTDLTQLLDQERPDLVAAANQVEALETILEDARNYEPLTQIRPEEGVRDLILEKPELLIEAEEIPFESQTRENKDLAKGESRILQAGKVGRRLKLIEVRQEEGKEIRTEVDTFVEVEAQDQITEVGTKEAEEAPMIPDVPLPTKPSEDSQETKPLLPPEDKKRKWNCSNFETDSFERDSSFSCGRSSNSGPCAVPRKTATDRIREGKFLSLDRTTRLRLPRRKSEIRSSEILKSLLQEVSNG